MYAAVLDCETWLRGAGGGIPPFVCFGWAELEDGRVFDSGLVTHKGEYTHVPEGTPAAGLSLVHPSEVVRTLFRRVRERNGRFVNANVVYDFATLCHFDNTLIRDVFDLYDADAVECTQLREVLLDIAAGSVGYWRDGRRSVAGKKVPKKYALASLAKFYTGAELDKTTWRLGYHRLHDVPLKDWAQGAIDYGIEDAAEAGLVYFGQRAEALEDIESGEIPNSPEQARAHWALYLSTLWGIRTDGPRVAEFKHELQRNYKILTAAMETVGFIRSNERAKSKNGSKNVGLIKKAIYDLGKEFFFPVLLTPKAEELEVDHDNLDEQEDPLKFISYSKEAITDLTNVAGIGLGSIDEGESNDLDEDKARSPLELGLDLANEAMEGKFDPEGLEEAPEEQRERRMTDEALQRRLLPLVPLHTSVKKLLTTYVPVLERGAKYPINPDCRPLKETGRVSYANPNLTNLPRAPGVRECYIARDGYVLSACDYDGLELHTLAQSCLNLVGHSALAEALNAGLDPHLEFACNHLISGGMDYEEGKRARKDENHPRHKEVVHARQIAKVANFGFPGGLGAKRFVTYAKNNGVIIDLDYAYDLKKSWFVQWPEMKQYFRFISDSITVDDHGDEGVRVEQLYSQRVRGKARYTAACNSYFQGLAADGAKEANYRIQKECYLPGGRLYGSRLLVFVHDETIMEHPEETAHERALIQAEIMVNTMHEYIPDVKPKATPALMRRWYKDASDVYDENGRLIPYEPREAA